MPNDKEFELDDLESFSFDDLSLDDEHPTGQETAGEDPFGVWVKSAPEDVGEEHPDVPTPASVPDTLPEEDFLSTEELAELDDSFDFVNVSDTPLEGENPLDEDISFLEVNEPAPGPSTEESTDEDVKTFDEISLDDFVSFDEAPEASTDQPPHGSLMAAPGSAEEEPNEDFLDIDIDIEDDINDEELEIIEGAQPRSTENDHEKGSDTFEAQEVDLSEFGDFEEVAPVDGEAEEPLAVDAMEPISDIAEVPGPGEDGFFEETVLEPEVTDFTLPDEDFLAEDLAALEPEAEVTLDLEPDDHTDLDHLKALEEDLTSGIRGTDEGKKADVAGAGSQEAANHSDLAALILGKIEQELSTIKQEISDLKKEVTLMRDVPPAVPAPAVPETPAPEAAAPEPVGADKPRGFFDEEDDETIALTGDELDNLLSTAEISEGEDPGMALEEDLLDLDAEGNLVEPEDGHVTDEEFLAGTALDLNVEGPLSEVETEPGDFNLGVPESIELEEGLPEGLSDDETEDLLAAPTPDFEMEPLSEDLLGDNPEPLEIPFDEEIGLELEETVAEMEPDAGFEPVEMALDSLPDLDTPVADDEGWSSPVFEDDKDLVEEALEVPAPVEEVPLPPAPRVSSDAVSGGSLSPTLKEELKAVLTYMDKLLASLPDDKIQEFAESEHFEVYKKLFEELGLIE